MSFGYMILCFQWSSGIMNAALVHENDLRSHRTARDRRALVSPLEPRSDGFIATFPESREGGDLLAFMRL